AIRVGGLGEVDGIVRPRPRGRQDIPIIPRRNKYARGQPIRPIFSRSERAGSRLDPPPSSGLTCPPSEVAWGSEKAGAPARRGGPLGAGGGPLPRPGAPRPPSRLSRRRPVRARLERPRVLPAHGGREVLRRGRTPLGRLRLREPRARGLGLSTQADRRLQTV